ncbi:MAG: NAD-dependent epimerase/dehydratase family protein [Pseudomonadota bacterium]
MRVLLTGAASHLAQALLPALLAHPDVESVLGLDLAPVSFAHPRFRALQANLLDADLAQHLAGMDAVVHLAFVVLGRTLGRERKNRALMREHNLRGTQRLCQAAAAAGVRRLVYSSSVAVYGAWPDNPPLIGEDWPRRPMPGFAYSEDKAAVEDWLDAFEAAAPELGIARLRIHAVVGPRAQALLNRIARTRFYVRVPGPQPLTQCIWEDDVVQAILLSLFSDARGPFNLAAPEPLSFRDIVRRHKRLCLPVPYALAEGGHRLFWQVSGAAGDPGWLAGLRHSLAVDTGRAERLLHWRPRYSVAECVDHLAGRRP